ncbi:MAG: aspartate carbamoyltransferase catalytic subunit [Octadecabacter sp.]
MGQRTDPSAWSDILSGDERILWQGRPDQAFHLGVSGILGAVFGGFFAGFALFWMSKAMDAGGSFWMFGLIHFSVGIVLILTALFGDTFTRRHTWYTLSTERAFIATNKPIIGRKLKSYPITTSVPLEHVIGPPDSLHFATVTKRTKNGSRTVPVGFKRIEDGKTVYALLRDIQKGHYEDAL